MKFENGCTSRLRFCKTHSKRYSLASHDLFACLLKLSHFYGSSTGAFSPLDLRQWRNTFAKCLFCTGIASKRSDFVLQDLSRCQTKL